MSRRDAAILAVVCGVLFLDGLDISLVGVALPSIKRDLGLDDSQLQWIVSGYVLGYGGLLLLGGRTADLLGRRRTLLVALGVFAVASLVGGVTSNGLLLICARFLKGATAAFTAPTGLSIITTSFAEGPARNRALSIFSATAASGFSLGLVIGGLTTEVGWRLAFLLPAPVAVGLLIAGIRLLPPEAPRPHDAQRLDVPGALTLTAATLLLVRTIVEAPSSGWGSGTTTGSFAVVALLLASFVVIERRSRSPLLRLGLLRSSALIRANLGVMTLFGAYIGFQFVFTLYLQAMNHWSPIKTALVLLPVGMLIAAGSVGIGPVVQRAGTERLIAIGFVGMVVGYALLLRIAATPEWVAVLLPATLLVGAGIGITYSPLNIQAVTGVAAQEQGIAGAIFQASSQIGAAVVLAAVTAVVTSHGAASTRRPVMLTAYHDGLLVVAAVAAAGLLITLTALVSRPLKAKAAA